MYAKLGIQPHIFRRELYRRLRISVHISIWGINGVSNENAPPTSSSSNLGGQDVCRRVQVCMIRMAKGHTLKFALCLSVLLAHMTTDITGCNVYFGSTVATLLNAFCWNSCVIWDKIPVSWLVKGSEREICDFSYDSTVQKRKKWWDQRRNKKKFAKTRSEIHRFRES